MARMKPSIGLNSFRGPVIAGSGAVAQKKIIYIVSYRSPSQPSEVLDDYMHKLQLIYTKALRDVSIAVKGGGADPDTNFLLKNYRSVRFDVQGGRTAKGYLEVLQKIAEEHGDGDPAPRRKNRLFLFN